MRISPLILTLLSFFVTDATATAKSRVVFSGEKRPNNLVAELLEVVEISGPSSVFTFQHPRTGYMFVAEERGEG